MCLFCVRPHKSVCIRVLKAVCGVKDSDQLYHGTKDCYFANRYIASHAKVVSEAFLLRGGERVTFNVSISALKG